MTITEGQSIDLARAMFLHPDDGRRDHPLGHEKRIAYIATLLSEGIYDRLSHHTADADIQAAISPLQVTKCHKVARGFAQMLFPEAKTLTMEPLHEDDFTGPGYEELKVAV